MSLLRRISIRYRIISGFLAAFVLIGLITSVQYISSRSVNATMREVVDVRQPRALETKGINAVLRDASSRLAFYAATGEASLADDFTRRLAEVRKLVERDIALLEGEPEAQAVLREVIAQTDTFEQLGNRIIALGSDQEANYPGVAYANRQINPTTLRMTQQAAGMVRSEVADGIDDDSQAERLSVYSDLRDALSNLMRGLRGYLAFRNPSQSENTLTYLEQTQKVLERIGEWPDKLTFEQEEYLTTLREDTVSLTEHVHKLLEIHGSEQWRTDSWLLRTEVLPLLNGIEGKIDALVEDQERSIVSASDGLMSDADTATTWSLWVAAIGLIAGIGVAVLITRSIAKPICAASGAMAEVAKGEGDLTRRLATDGTDEVSKLAQGFNDFVTYIQEVIAQTARTTSDVIGGVATTNDGIGRIVSRIVDQQHETDQVATAITEMSASVAEVAQSATRADEAAKGALDQTNNGKQIVAATANGIQSLAERLSGASALMQRLDADAKSIHSVVDVIRSIAEQTNLLALNAAIEAARAGESGRGFAVVADEVRTLANRTHQSTEEISDMIGRLGTSANEAVNLMSAGRDMADTNASQARDALGALSSIEDAVRTISDLNSQIAVAVEEQRAVADDIHRAAEHVSSGGKANTDEAAQVRETAVQLGDMIANLQELVGRFRIDSAGLDFEKAKGAHLAWRARVRNFLDGKGSLTPQEVVSHRDCVLGKWYYGAGLQRYGELAEMRELEAPHARLHAVIGEIVQCQHNHDAAGAERRFGELSTLSSTIVSGLERLEEIVSGNESKHGAAS